MPSDVIYDVFLSHAGPDKPAVCELARKLRQAGLEAFLDTWHLVPGDPWQEGLERALEQSRTCAVFLGPGEIGPWQNEEMREALDTRARKPSYRVIPVLLPGAAMPEMRELPRFLKRLTWVEFRHGLDDLDAFHRLCCGIRGVSPGDSSDGRELGGGAARPEPKYSSEDLRRTAEELKQARKERRKLKIQGKDTTSFDQRIIGMERVIRAGVQLEAGDCLLGERYELIELLGHGGFADVWLAWDEERDHRVAIKVLHNQYARDATRVKRFKSGAKQMGKLDHPGIVRVLSQVREDRGYRFFVMEYLPGGDFHHAVRAGSLPLEKRWKIILKVDEALQFAHERGVIHRDVKPANILLDENLSPKLTDFDLVRAAETTGGTRTGAMGTFVYAAPEMLHRPQDADSTVDVYGLGMTAIFALYGKDLPLDVFRDAPGFLQKIEAHDAVRKVLAKAVEWRQDDRWASVAEFCHALSDAVSFQVSISKLIADEGPETLQGARQILLAGEEWQASDPDSMLGKPLRQTLAQRLTQVMQFRNLPAPERHRAGLIASDLGDLPDDLDAFVTLPEAWFGYPFKIGKYPVTNAQYRRFIEDGGYERGITGIDGRTEPSLWQDPDYNRATQPVVGVSWYEAVAYCEWLTAKLRASGEIGEEQVVRLPTLEESEKVGSGSEGRRFPWGDEEDVRCLNCKESEIERPSPVHMYPDGVSPEGVWDLSGNAWEWTSTKEKKSFSTYVLAGGTFYWNISLNTSVARLWIIPDLVWDSSGFRVSVSPLLP